MAPLTKPIRILQVPSSLSRGSGVANVILNWHRNMDRSKVQFDYLIYLNYPKDASFEQEVNALGGRVFYMPYRGIFHSFSFLSAVWKFFRTHKYQTIHSHVTHLGMFYLPIAKYFGVKNIFQHSHGTKWSDKKLNAARNYLMLHSAWPLITRKFACSDLAGKVWYKKNYQVIPNAIDTKRFAFSQEKRKEQRKALGLKDEHFLVGSVGRFELQKNHSFILDIFSELIKKLPTARLLLIGDGSLKSKIQQKAEEMKLTPYIKFMPNQKNIEDIFCAMDCLLMPSLYEGLPVVGVEAQSTGLPGLFSDTITQEVKILPQSKFLSLNQSPQEWAEGLLLFKATPSDRSQGTAWTCKNGFNIQDISGQLLSLYLQEQPYD